MIPRLALLFLLVIFPAAQARDGPAGCSVRIDVLDGEELTEGLESLFKESVAAMSAQDCALTCFHRKCDVAYYHTAERLCQFRADSASSSFSALGCNRFVAEPTAANTNGDASDRISRFCVRCSLDRSVVSNKISRQRSFVTKRITIPLRPEGNTSIHRSSSRSRKPLKKALSLEIPSNGSPIQRFVVRGQGGNFTLSRQPMRLKFSGPRLGKSGRSLRKERYFHRNMTQQQQETGRLKKKKGNGIAKR